MSAEPPRNSVTWYFTMALRRTAHSHAPRPPSENLTLFVLGCMPSFCPLLRPSPLRAFFAVFPRFKRGNPRPSSPLKHASLASEPSPPLRTLLHSSCWATCSVSSIPSSLTPPRVFACFPAVPARKRAPLHSSETQLACLGVLAPLHAPSTPFAGLHAQCSFIPSVPCPSARLRGFPAVPARRTAPLHPSEMCLASLGALAPRALPILFSFQYYLGYLGFCSFKCLCAPERNFSALLARIRAGTTLPHTCAVLDFSRRYIPFYRLQDFVLC